MDRCRTLIALIAPIALAGTAAAQPGQTEPVPTGAPPMTNPPDPGAYAQHAGAPPPQHQGPPPGSTQATFVSTSLEPWDVLLDRQPVCATPCSIWVEPMRFVSLRTQERSPVRLDLGYLQPGSVAIAAKPLEEGKYAAGIVFTTFSGMGLITGVTLTAIGCSTDRSTMCTAGLVTGGVSAVGLYASIMLMKRALPEARIGAATPYVAGNTLGLAGSF